MPDTVPALLDFAVDRWGPDHVLLADRLGHVALGEVAARVGAGVAALRAFGVGPGDRVAASLPNDRTILELFLATASAGAVWVGLHQSLASPERAALETLADPTLVVGDGGVGVEEWLGAVERYGDAAPPARDVDPHAPGAIAFTSGTTGAPKGIPHSQHNLVVPAASFAWAGRVTPGTRVGVAYPLTILNLVIQSLLTSLAAGATCCVLDRRDTEGILAGIERHGVEQLSMVPATAHDIVHHHAGASVPTLQRVMVGGSFVTADLARRLGETLGVVVDHGYGLTEAPGLVTSGVAGDPITAGRALDHVDVDVIDDDGRSLVGEPGEIVLRARRSGPWAGVWTPPVGYEPEVRTGDAGRLEPSGELTVLDRRSELIVRGGSNIQPAEVEQALAAHTDVEVAVVVGRPDDRLGEVPVALVQLHEGARVTTFELREHCSARIAGYKVPEIRMVPTVQRNAMGKPDRRWAKALAAQSTTEPRGDR